MMMNHKDVHLSKEDLDIKVNRYPKSYQERFNFVAFVGFLCILYGVMSVIIMYFNGLGFNLANVVIGFIGFAILGIQSEFTEKERMIEDLSYELRVLKKKVDQIEKSEKQK